MKLLSMKFFFYPPATSTLLAPNILLKHHHVRDPVSHPHKIYGKTATYIFEY
jgi:hypothetical protein